MKERRCVLAEKAPEKKVSGMLLLKGVVTGLVAIALVMGGVCCALPRQGDVADQTRLYDYVYSGTKSESVDFTTTNMSDDGILTFGTSELYISSPLVNQCPQKVFGESVSGVDMTYVGEAFDQSLWQAIAAGAYAPASKNRKAVLMLSPQWFFKGNGQQSKFSSKFSYQLYKGFLENDSIGDDTKAYVRQRLETLGVDGTQIAAANDDTFVDAINDAAYQFSNDLRIRSKIDALVKGSPKNSLVRSAGEPTGKPDWDALLSDAQAQGEQSCTNNDYGIHDAYWDKNSQYKSEQNQDFVHADDEWADFQCFLRVCREAGLEPLVVILPMHGGWYDEMGVTSDIRAQFYDQARSLCDEAGVAYADFSSCEYEKYFLCDTVHPGWIGWVRIEHAVYDFVNGQDNAFLGGAE
ncbi:MAG: D-alanyl-lipoteichoic acid biosynthesis protein DltD [Coriobacteriia bacterium]|nr:MAG: D-alanyl-lipoteichoic acid biosynthesis protein DltD [Coriobacteriia bacterium]